MNVIMFVYEPNKPVLVGDEVVTQDGRMATIDMVILPDTKDSMDYSCPKTGGVLLRFSNGGLELLTQIDDEPLELIGRKNIKG
jgi:hypothetical protein